MLGPERALYAGVVGLQGGADVGLYGLVVVGALQVVVAVAGYLHPAVVLLLPAINIVVEVRRHDVLQSQRCGFLCSSLRAGPAHDGGAGGANEVNVGITLSDALVPKEELVAAGGGKVCHFLDKVRLQLAGVGHALVLHFLLTLGILLPGRGGALITADVNVGIGEDVHQFADDVLGKLYGLRVGHVEYVGRNAPGHPVLVQSVGGAAEFGIGCHGGHEVSGHVNFGQNLDVAFAGIGHYVTHLFLRIIIRSVGTVGIVAALRPVPLVGIGRDAAHGGQARPFLDFGAPALVVAQVPVEAVEFVDGHEVEDFLHLFHTEEVAGGVEHEAAVAKAGLVGNAQAGQGVAFGRSGGVLS
ncbi:uncharacterized protein BN736_01776 [Prevotella sp. CAG:617]|nr:uncharacterized protein BN736_01776 [Prevotella sp. CAG:617]